MKARIGLEPITIDNPDFDRVKELVLQKAPVVTPESKIKDTEKKLAAKGFVENIMKRYESEWKNAKNTQTISPDMFIPQEKLK